MSGDRTVGEAGSVVSARARRRNFTDEYRRKIVAECQRPGASVSGVSLRHGINANVVRKWIVRYQAGGLVASGTMLPVVVKSSAGVRTGRPPEADRPMGRVDTMELVIDIGEVRIAALGSVREILLETVIRTVLRR